MSGWALIAGLAAAPVAGGYWAHFEGGSTMVSEEGMQGLIDTAYLTERFEDALLAFSELLAERCEQHDLPLIKDGGEPFEWSINDYAPWGDDPRWPVFILAGWHQGEAPFCVAAWARGTSDGSLIAMMNHWRKR